MLPFWSPNDNPFWKMDWRKFDIHYAAKSVLVTLSLTIFTMIFAAFILHFAYPDRIVTGLVLLSIATLGHLIARIFEPEVPSFQAESQKGTLDFLRLLPFSPHTLVIARSFPAFAFRLYLTILWLPLYLASFIILGISTVSAFYFAAIAGLCERFMFRFVILFVFVYGQLQKGFALQEFLFACLTAILFPLRTFGLLRGTDYEWLVDALLVLGATLVALPEGDNFTFDEWLPFHSGSLPLLQGMALLFFASGIAHFERTSRWIESPKGLRRIVFVFPIAIMLFATQGILWGYLKQELKWQNFDCFTLCSFSNFMLSSILFWLWQNWSWSEKSVPTKEPFSLLTETFSLRIVTALMPFIGCWLSGNFPSQLDFNFINLWLWLNFVDAFNLAVSRSISLKAMACWQISGVIWLAFVSAFPCLALLSEKFSWFAAISPSASLFGLAIGLIEGKPIFLTVPFLQWQLAIHPVSFAASFFMPTIFRGILLWSVWKVLPVLKEIAASEIFTHIQAGLGKLNFVAEWLFLFPALERRIRERTENPVFRHFLLVTRWRFSWQPYLIAFIFGWMLPWYSGFITVVYATLIVCFVAYQVMHNYLRKLHQIGELWMWLITPIKSETIILGLIEGIWWWQIKWGIVAFCVFVGNFAKHWKGPLSAFVGMWELYVSLSVFAFIAIAMSIEAVFDALSARHQVFSQRGRKWSLSRVLLKLALISGPLLFSPFVWFGQSFQFAFFLMIVIWAPIWFAFSLIWMLSGRADINRLVRLLEEIRKAPMDKLPIQ